MKYSEKRLGFKGRSHRCGGTRIAVIRERARKRAEARAEKSE